MRLGDYEIRDYISSDVVENERTIDFDINSVATIGDLYCEPKIKIY